MLTTVAGIYRDGRVELNEKPCNAQDGARVFVTFMGASESDLRAHGIDERQAADIRASFATFAEDWDAPDMEIYDRYDAVKSGG